MIAVVFPGQGSQYVGMGKEFYESYSLVRDIFKRASDSIGLDMKNLCFSSPEEELKLTENAQPAILTVSYALYSVLCDTFPSLRDKIRFFAGHSLGEYTACVASGIMGFEDAVYAVRMRGKFMQEAVPVGEGKMVAVIGVSPEEVESACSAVGGVVEPANYNSPEQIVVAGRAKDVDRFVEYMRAKGVKKIIPLNVSAPFHCSLMEPAKERLKEVLDKLTFNDPYVPVVSNVTATAISKGDEERDLLVRQVTGSVKWYQSVLYMRSMGVSIFIEVGPSKVLSGLVKRTDRTVKVFNVEKPEDMEALREVF